MGLYDRVDYSCACPICAEAMTDFQTKDTDCDLETVSPEEVDFFYSLCGSCGGWVQFIRFGKTSFTRTVQVDRKVVEEHTILVVF